jgi:hypothetical protein
MDFHLGTALITSALLASVILVMRPPSGRLVPAIGFAAAAIAALIDFRIIQLSSTKLRVDVVLPALLALTGAISWSRSSTRSAVTAATVMTIGGLILLLSALRMLRG